MCLFLVQKSEPELIPHTEPIPGRRPQCQKQTKVLEKKKSIREYLFNLQLGKDKAEKALTANTD